MSACAGAEVRIQVRHQARKSRVEFIQSAFLARSWEVRAICRKCARSSGDVVVSARRRNLI